MALTEKELDMLKIVKDYYGINSREVIQGVFSATWDEIPKSRKKSFENKWKKEKKKIGVKFKRNRKKSA